MSVYATEFFLACVPFESERERERECVYVLAFTPMYMLACASASPSLTALEHAPGRFPDKDRD